MLIRKFVTVMALLGLITGAPVRSAAADEYASPDLVEIKTPAINPNESDFEPVLGTYTYDVNWEGIPAAELVSTVEQEGDYYKITVKARTYRAIDLFYKLRYNAEGIISADNYSPLKTVIDHRENSRHRFTELSFDEKGQVEAVRIDLRKGEVKTINFDPENHMLDPFAAAFLARSVNWEQGMRRDFDTFNGKSRYLISLLAEEKVKLEVDGVERDVWVISPKVYNLISPEQSKKLKEAKIYLTADKNRDILKIVSSVFIGSVYTELEKIEPSPPVRTRLAKKSEAKIIK